VNLSNFSPSSAVLQGSIKKKIDSLRRWSSASMKRHPKPTAKSLSLSSPVGDPGAVWLQEGDRRKLGPIVDSVFGQVRTLRGSRVASWAWMSCVISETRNE